MAIARDAHANGLEVGASSLTFSHTCAANAVLFVSFYTSGTVSTVKYNAVSMTLVNSHNLSGLVTYLYVLNNPTSGAHNVVITLTGNADTTATSFSYTGANILTQPGASADGGQSASSPFTTSLTTTYNNSWMVMAVRNSTGSTSADTGSSLVRDINGLQIYDTNATVNAGSNSMAVSFGAGTTGTVIAELIGIGPSVISVNDTGTRTEAVSFIDGFFISLSETIASITDKLLPFRIFSRITKSITTWISQSKS